MSEPLESPSRSRRDENGKPDESESRTEFTAKPVPPRAREAVRLVASEMGGPYMPSPEEEGAVGHTHFDGPGSEDNSVVVLMDRKDMSSLPSQAMVRIKSLDDDGQVERAYLGVVVAGPFAEPDGLSPNSPIVEMSTVRGQKVWARYHGRAHVQILGEEVTGQLIPPRFRPKPNSPVHVLSPDETAAALKLEGNVCLGTVVGQDEIEVRISTEKKEVLPRHTGILGTTGGGKSTTVSGYISSLQKAGVAAIVIDVEPEYTDIDRPTEDPKMLAALAGRGQKARGTDGLVVYYPVGRKTGREGNESVTKAFCLPFADLSPYTVMDILDLNEAQRERYYTAYEATKHVMKELGIFPKKESKEEKVKALELDEFDRGYPRMTLSHLIDVVNAVVDQLSKTDEAREPYHPHFKSEEAKQAIQARLKSMKPSSVTSWQAVLGRLWTVHRLGVFDNRVNGAEYLKYSDLIAPGRVSVIDLGDTDSTLVNNLLIASILRGVQRVQEKAVDAAKKNGSAPTPVNIIIEESHEFLSRERIGKMQSLFQQVARIAKRGRKRWLGLTFVTQLPQHLPDEVLGLLNNFVLHKISDSNVVDRLRRSISGPDTAQWGLLPGLAPGQALVSFSGMTRPLLTAIDPTPCYLRLVD
jgi:hypothetical protein